MVCHIQIVGGGKFLARNLGMFPFKTVEIQFPFFFFFPKDEKKHLLLEIAKCFVPFCKVKAVAVDFKLVNVRSRLS